jgi:hypothetical protein
MKYGLWERWDGTQWRQVSAFPTLTDARDALGSYAEAAQSAGYVRHKEWHGETCSDVHLCRVEHSDTTYYSLSAGPVA